MPDVTVSTEYSEPQELKSAPPDGYICVRPMPFGKMLKRRDAASKMSMEAATSTKGKGKRNDEETQKISIETLQYHARLQEFDYCIGDHNLTDKSGRKLDFSNPLALDSLNPRVGAEIEAILDKLNGEDDDLEDFTQHASNSSEDKRHLSVS